jgi:hypothetical protein
MARDASPSDVSDAAALGSSEPFRPTQLAAGAAHLLYLTLPHPLIMGPKWPVPGPQGVLLPGLVATTPTRFAGAVLWVTNVLIFGTWYWGLDSTGPGRRRRRRAGGGSPDLLFPQMAERRLVRELRPGFGDYLYTPCTNATAFSPTDTMPLTAIAKLLMAVQSRTALVTILLVVARAVNALG